MLDHLDTAPDVALGVLESLAQLAGDDLRQFVVVFLEQRLVTQHHPRALGNRGFLPAGEGFAGTGHRLLDLLRAGAGDLRQGAVVEGIADRDALGAETFDEGSRDEVADWD